MQHVQAREVEAQRRAHNAPEFLYFVDPTADGLARAEALGQDGGFHPLPPGCRLVGQATKVTVLDRVPPGAAKISVDATRETGWTDAWLPDKAGG